MEIKKLLMILYTILLFTSCSNDINNEIKGSWFRIYEDEKERIYEEIHVDDSLFIYCYYNSAAIIPFTYRVKGDSIYLFSDPENVENKYQISYSRMNKEEMNLNNDQQKLSFTKIDNLYKDLNVFLVDFESLDSLTYDFHQRMNLYLIR